MLYSVPTTSTISLLLVCSFKVCKYSKNAPLLKQYKYGISVSWEGNRRSGVALAMRHRQ